VDLPAPDPLFLEPPAAYTPRKEGSMAANMPTALVDPAPRSLDVIFLPNELEELRSLVRLQPESPQKPFPDATDEILKEAAS